MVKAQFGGLGQVPPSLRVLVFRIHRDRLNDKGSHRFLALTCTVESVHACPLVPGHSEDPDRGISDTGPCSRAKISPVTSHSQSLSEVRVRLELVLTLNQG